MEDNLLIKICTICAGTFTTKYSRKNICSFGCGMIASQERARMYIKRKKENRKLENCEVCGFNEAIDIHHENQKTYFLCPNHHAIITRNGKSINDLLPHK